MEASTAAERPRTGAPPSSDAEPTLDARIDTAARGQGVDAAGEDALLAYYLGNAPAPNATASEDFTVELDDGRVWECTLASIEWAEWRESQEKATSAQTGLPDVYVQASYVVAYAMRRPMLGRMIARLRDAAGEDEDAKSRVPADGAAFLRGAFKKQAGTLLMLQRNVLRISKLDEDGGGGVKRREVEAGKL